MDNGRKHLDFIRDVVYVLRERGAEASRESEATGSSFHEGREFGIRQVLSFMQHQAEVFGIPLYEICLAGFDAMVDPLEPPPPKAG